MSALGYAVSMYVNCAGIAEYGPSSNDGGGSDDDNVGAIAGGVIGALVGVGLLVRVSYYFLVMKKKEADADALDKDGNAL